MTEVLFSPAHDFDWGPHRRLIERPAIRVIGLTLATVILASSVAFVWWSIVAPSR